MNSFIIEFLMASTIMGLGIGLDAAVATALVSHAYVKYQRNSSNRRMMIFWLCGITATHTLFPMAGYGLSYLGVHTFPFLSFALGITAFALIAHFIYEELTASAPEGGDVAFINGALLLAVSWDALWSGPAKSAQVLGWPEWAIWASFLVVGAIVAFLSISAFALVRWQLQNFVLTQLCSSFLRWLQLSVLAYFGSLALVRYSFNWSVPGSVIFIFSGIIIYLLMSLRQKTDQTHAYDN